MKNSTIVFVVCFFTFTNQDCFSMHTPIPEVTEVQTERVSSQPEKRHIEAPAETPGYDTTRTPPKKVRRQIIADQAQLTELHQRLIAQLDKLLMANILDEKYEAETIEVIKDTLVLKPSSVDSGIKLELKKNKALAFLLLRMLLKQKSQKAFVLAQKVMYRQPAEEAYTDEDMEVYAIVNDGAALPSDYSHRAATAPILSDLA